ncbi:MAG TPA: hypothetical protein VNR36_11350 [Pseudolysinimonas sp.]|nr:hypothetical protein [Pseudolysinimonas sp.]
MTVLDWLLDSDPAIRWQVKRDLLDAPPDEVAAERALVASTGWGAALLDLQDPDGRWDGGTYRPGWAREDRPFFDAWTATHFTLVSLRELGAHPDDARVRAAIGRVRDDVRWEPDDPDTYFHGETEPCINGLALANATYFGEDPSHVGETVLAGRLPDGGWNCFPDENRPVSSYHSTICVLEGLLAWQQAGGPVDRITEARRGGEEYLLERGLFRRRSDGSIADPRFTMLSYPGYWFYDILRALDHLREASRVDGTRPDPRCAEAIGLLEAKRDGEGRWRHENTHEGPRLIELEGGEGTPSRWSTLRAMRVLRWWHEG